MLIEKRIAEFRRQLEDTATEPERASLDAKLQEACAIHDRLTDGMLKSTPEFHRYVAGALRDESPPTALLASPGPATTESQEAPRLLAELAEGLPASELTAELLLSRGNARYWAREYEKAAADYERALAVKPGDHQALNNWGVALDGLAQMKGGGEAERLFALAIEKYEQALAVKPDDHEALYNWGGALDDLARMKGGGEAERLFALAIEKYEQALAVKPDDHEALNNWGGALAGLARMKGGGEAERLFALAIEKYEQALAVKPDYHRALNNWGGALAGLAGMKGGGQAERLFALAMEKYEQALAVKPDYHQALNSWGVALAGLARMERDGEAERLFALAIEKYEQALAVKPDYHWALYNLGCLRALRGDPAGALADIEAAVNSGFSDAATLRTDTDLDALRVHPEYGPRLEALIARIEGGGAADR